jgi:hypothetical protein
LPFAFHLLSPKKTLVNIIFIAQKIVFGPTVSLKLLQKLYTLKNFGEKIGYPVPKFLTRVQAFETPTFKDNFSYYL